MNKSLLTLIEGGAFVALLCTSFGIGWIRGGNAAISRVTPKVDTLTVCRVDTQICPVTRVVRERVTDTVRLYIRDTAFIEVPRWEKVYEDTSYRAVVSGYDPRLDSLTIYPRIETRTVTRTDVRTEYVKLRPSFSVGITAGYGFSTETMRFSPVIGAGISYNIASFGYRK